MALRAAFMALFAALAAHAVLALGAVPVPAALTDGLYFAVETGSVALVAARSLTVRRNRLGWALVALGIGMWVAGDYAWKFGAPAASGVLYIAMLLFVYLGLAALL